MPSIGDTKTLYGRNYVYLNPNDTLGPGAWALSSRDAQSGAGAGEPEEVVYGTAVVASTSAVLQRGNLVYMDSNGQVLAAKADNIATGVPVGVSLTGANPGQTITFTTNTRLDFTNTTLIVDGAPSQLTPGALYYLSDTNAGQWTTTPDTTTSGNVVIQCGQAVSVDFMAIEIQSPLVV